MAGIPPSKVHPKYLNTNATIHTWAFSAVAELIDNAYDPDVKAKEFRINQRLIQDKVCLTFMDNGKGMTPETLHNMMSFGYNDKEKFETPRHQAIGQYGNGFKSGSMRLGRDAIVFTRQVNTMSVGLLSQTYLNNINAQTVLVPIVTWNLPDKTKRLDQSVTASLDAILQHSSIFKTEEDLLKELDEIDRTGGTKIIIYNLNCRSGDLLELDFQSDPSDIRDPETHLKDTNARQSASIMQSQKRCYMVSLREYCKILYLKPKMKIWIRGKKVRTLLIRKSLRRSQEDIYSPSWATQKILITFGFATERLDDYGVMLYRHNRLILAYEKLGCQKQTQGFGKDVIAVLEANSLEVKNNKQDFTHDCRYSTLLENVSKKLKDFWNVKNGNAADMEDDLENNDEDVDNWVQCDNCNKWRLLRNRSQMEDLPSQWYCRLNEDFRYNRCDLEEQKTEDDEEERRTYKKKKKDHQKKSGRQSEQSSVTNSNRNKKDNENRDQLDKSLESTEEALELQNNEVLAENEIRSRRENRNLPPTETNADSSEREISRAQIRQSLANNPIRRRNINESVHQSESVVESAGQTPITPQCEPLTGLSRKRTANDRTLGSVNTEELLDFSTTAIPPQSSRPVKTRRMDTPASRLVTATVSINQITPTSNRIPTTNEQLPLPSNFCNAETQTKELIRNCNRECVRMDEELRGEIEREKKKTLEMERRLTEAIQKEHETEKKLQEANIEVEKANKKIVESSKEIEQVKREKEQANREKEQANREKDQANREKEQANREKKEAHREKEQANREKEQANKEKDKAIREKEQANKERKEAYREKEHANMEKEQANKEKEDAYREKRQADREKYKANREKEQANMEKEQANKEKEDAKREKEQADREKYKANREKEQASKEKEQAYREKEQANKEKDHAIREKEQANRDKEQADREKEQAIRENEQANREKEQADSDKEQADREKEQAIRENEQAYINIDESFRKAEVNQERVVMTERKLQEAEQQLNDAEIKANSFESQLKEFRRNVHIFLQRHARGDIGTEDEVEDLVLTMIADGQS